RSNPATATLKESSSRLPTVPLSSYCRVASPFPDVDTGLGRSFAPDSVALKVNRVACAATGAVNAAAMAKPSILFFILCLLVQARSEEHTSELQSRENLVCRLLLEKKKNKIIYL